MQTTLGAEEREAYAFVREARRARRTAEQMRRMAAERAVALETKLREAAESGTRAEIARCIEARRQLLAGRGPRRTGAIATLLALCIGTAATLMPSSTGIADARPSAAHAEAPMDAARDPLKLRLDYTLGSRIPR